MAVLEAKIEQRIIDWLRRNGWYIPGKLHIDGVRGWPDITAFKEGVVLLIEVKQPLVGVVAKHQERIHKDLLKAGHTVHIVESLEEVQAIVGA